MIRNRLLVSLTILVMLDYVQSPVSALAFTWLPPEINSAVKSSSPVHDGGRSVQNTSRSEQSAGNRAWLPGINRPLPRYNHFFERVNQHFVPSEALLERPLGANGTVATPASFEHELLIGTDEAAKSISIIGDSAKITDSYAPLSVGGPVGPNEDAVTLGNPMSPTGGTLSKFASLAPNQGPISGGTTSTTTSVQLHPTGAVAQGRMYSGAGSGPMLDETLAVDTVGVAANSPGVISGNVAQPRSLDTAALVNPGGPGGSAIDTAVLNPAFGNTGDTSSGISSTGTHIPISIIGNPINATVAVAPAKPPIRLIQGSDPTSIFHLPDWSRFGTKYDTTSPSLLSPLYVASGSIWPNPGEYAIGFFNSGTAHTGVGNSGSLNTGSFNSGTGNIGFANLGTVNFGLGHSGNQNIGFGNTGNQNIGLTMTDARSTGVAVTNVVASNLFGVNSPSIAVEAVGSPGTLSGNIVQVPVHVPVNIYGNGISAMSESEEPILSVYHVGERLQDTLETASASSWGAGIKDGEKIDVPISVSQSIPDRGVTSDKATKEALREPRLHLPLIDRRSVVEHSMNDGSFLVQHEKPVVLHTALADIRIAPHSTVYVIQVGKEVGVYNMMDWHKGAVEVTVNGHQYVLHLGESLVLSRADVNDFAKLSLADGVQCNGMKLSGTENGTKVFQGNFAYGTVLDTSPQFHALVNSTDPHQKKVALEMLKTLAAMEKM